MSDEREQYEALYRAQHPRIVRLCFLLLNDRAEADEVAQEVFLKLLRPGKLRDQPLSWEAWLGRVAVNACHDRRRSRWWKWWRGKQVELADDHIPDQSRTPEEEVVSREEQERIWRSFRLLSPRQQEVFALRYVEGWSSEEVANLLGLTTGSVKQHLFRAVHHLREALGDTA